MPDPLAPPSPPPVIVPSAVDQLATLFDLGRRVMSVLDLDELLERIPDLIARVNSFDAFAVYLLDRRAATLRVAYAVGNPQGAVGSTVLRVAEGLVGTAVSEKLPVLANELTSDARYVPIAPGMQSELVSIRTLSRTSPSYVRYWAARRRTRPEQQTGSE